MKIGGIRVKMQNVRDEKSDVFLLGRMTSLWSNLNKATLGKRNAKSKNANGNMITIHQMEEKGNEMATAHFPKPGLRSPAAMEGNCQSTAFDGVARVRSVATEINRVSILRSARFPSLCTSQWFGMVYFAVWLFFVGQGWAQYGQRVGGASGGAEFKAFLTSPPPIQRVAFWCNDPLKIQSRHGFFLGSWETGSLLCLQISSNPDDSMNTNRETDLELIGSYRDYNWRYDKMRNTVYTSKVFPDESPSANGVDESTYVRGIRMLSPILNLGLLNVIPGSVVWSGNDFSVTNVDGQLITGSLSFSNNRPSRLDYYVSRDAEAYHWWVIYDYRSNVLSPDIPDWLEIYGSDKSHTQKFAEYGIQSLVAAIFPLKREHFLPDKYIRSNATVIIAHRDGTVSKRLPSGVLQKIEEVRRPHNRVVPIFLMISTAVPVIIYLIKIRTVQLKSEK